MSDDLQVQGGVAVIGLQSYAYDVLDEGVEAVADGTRAAGADVLLPLVSYCDEDIELGELGPDRGGVLPHNPVREFHVRDAHFGDIQADYPASLHPGGGSESGVDGASGLRQMVDAYAESGPRVVPWLTLLTQRVAYESDASCAVNARGETVRGWLCPRRAEVRQYVRALIEDVVRVGRSSAVLVDRIRYPEWGTRGIVDACTCFCDDCMTAARDEGVDMPRARAQLLGLIELLESDPAAAAEAFAATSGSGLRGVRAAGVRSELIDLLRFRQAAVEGLVAEARTVAGQNGAELWLDVWPPSYAWLLGQDFGQLATLGSWIRPFLYFRWGGGADVASFINHLGPDAETREGLYRAFRAFFGFPGPDRFDHFVERGLSSGFVTTELDFAAQMIAGRCRLAAGLQLWSVDSEAIRAGIDAAANAEGIMFHAYGWATREALAEAGDRIREVR